MTDFEVLTRTIWAEAQGESQQGKMAVGAAVRNWAQRKNINVFQVVSEPGQYESYPTQFYRAPFQATNDPAIIQSRQAATAVLNGADPTFGMDHFCNPGKSPCRWHWQQVPPKVVIGQHFFVRARRTE